MSKSDEPVASVVPETEWDKTPMAYTEVPPTDEDGNPVSARKSAAGQSAKSQSASQTPKEK